MKPASESDRHSGEDAQTALVADAPEASSGDAKARADVLVRNQRYAEAAAAYRALLQADRDNPEVENNLANVYRILGKGADAEQHYRRALAINPGFARALTNLGSLLLGRGAEEEGEAALRRAYALAPSDPITAGNLAQFLLQKHDPDGARELYGKMATNAEDVRGGAVARGHWHRLRGEADLARKCYRAAHEMSPSDPDISTSLVAVAIELDDPKDALNWARHAFELQPNRDGTCSALAGALLANDRPAEALIFANKAVQAKPTSVPALMALAKAMAACGDQRGAFETWRKVLKRDPKSVLALNALAHILIARGRTAKARPLLERALALAPGDAVVTTNLATAYFELGEFSAARRMAVRAMRIDPNSDSVRLNYARTLQAFGRHVAARGHYETLLRRDPLNIEAFFALAQNSPARIGDAQIDAMESELSKPGINVDRRGLGHMGLAAVYDYRGQAEAAFKHALAGKAQEAGRYDPARFGRFVDASIETFTERFFADRREFGAREAVPIFIVGLPRSGTTLVEQIIASHPRVKGGGELTALNAVADAVASYGSGGLRYPRALTKIGEPAVLRLAHQYLKAIKPLKGGAARVTDKMPLNSLRVGLIRLLLPEAKIVYCTRNVRDTFISNLLMKYRSPIPFTCRPDWFAAFYQDYERLRGHWQQVVPAGAIHWLSYEGLVHSFEEQARALIDFCGLPWDDQCLAFHRNRGPIVTGSNVQVRQRIYQSSVGRGDRYAHLLGGLASAESPDSRGDGSDG